MTHFLLLFAVGWILGRSVNFGRSRDFGRVMALLFEAVIMLIVMIVSSRCVFRRFDVLPTPGSTIPMGLVALGILAPAEIAGGFWGRGQSLQDYAASLLTAPGVISLVMFVLFAVMPTLVTLVRRGHVRAIC